MRLYKQTEEYVADTEGEAIKASEYFKKDGIEKGYVVSSCGYTHKEKKQKGEVIDEKWIVKVVKVIGGIWDE